MGSVANAKGLVSFANMSNISSTFFSHYFNFIEETLSILIFILLIAPVSALLRNCVHTYQLCNTNNSNSKSFLRTCRFSYVDSYIQRICKLGRFSVGW